MSLVSRALVLVLTDFLAAVVYPVLRPALPVFVCFACLGFLGGGFHSGLEYGTPVETGNAILSICNIELASAASQGSDDGMGSGLEGSTTKGELGGPFSLIESHFRESRGDFGISAGAGRVCSEVSVDREEARGDLPSIRDT